MRVQNILRHERHVRGPDGAVYWPRLAQRMYAPRLDTREFSKCCTSDRVRFEYSLDPHGEPQYIRSKHGHSGVPRIDPRFFTYSEAESEEHIIVFDTSAMSENRKENMIRILTHWDCDKLLKALAATSDKIRFEYCLDSHGGPQSIRPIHGHSGVPRINPKYFTLLQIPYAWIVYIYRAGLRTITGQSSKEDCLREAPAIVVEGKRASSHRCFHQRSRCQGRASNGALHTHSKRPDHDAVYTSDPTIAQDRGLKFLQTGSFWIILYDTMPPEPLVRVVKLHHSETEILFDTRSGKVTDATRSIIRFKWNGRNPHWRLGNTQIQLWNGSLVST